VIIFYFIYLFIYLQQNLWSIVVAKNYGDVKFPGEIKQQTLRKLYCHNYFGDAAQIWHL